MGKKVSNLGALEVFWQYLEKYETYEYGAVHIICRESKSKHVEKKTYWNWSSEAKVMAKKVVKCFYVYIK